ncbi:GTPase [Acinetobacter faecalis]|uniref:GTPase n=1 Tax=Acinetobacter faecalis TaxID=2665161 RepID=UPI002A91EC8F|nr:GTPase [Acinetobacter faecalis]MDY6455831.1 GTPase [Acinetobacter faecalis]
MDKTANDIFQTSNELTLEQLSFCQNSVTSIQQWSGQLEIHHLGDSARALFNAIVEISELNCKETLRFDLIQAIHPIIDNILNSLEKHSFNQSLISDSRNTQIIELALSLRIHLSKIYIDIAQRSKQQLQDQSFSFFSFKSKKNLETAQTAATYYALQQLSLLFYHQQMLYNSALTGQWLITHSLLANAMKNNFNLTNINQILGTKHQIKNINQAYAQIVLLDIFNTHQIRPAEIQGLFLCSYEWARLVQVLPKESTLSRYVVDSTKDHAPIFNTVQETNCNTNIYISTQALLEYLNENQGRNNEKFSANEKLFLTPALHFHIHNILTNTAERRYERYEYNARIKICFGLSAAHFYLSKAKNFNETLALGSNYQIKGASNFLDPNHHTIPINETPSKNIDRESKKIYQVDVLDISVTGYRIQWNGITPKNLKTGEFILVQENSRSPWRGGVIRWIKQSSEQSLELGLEILAQDIAPCACYLQVDRNTGHYHPALIMQNTQLDEISTTLILPGIGLLKDKQSIQLRLGTDELKVFLIKPLLITQSFMRFNFELLNEQQRPILDNFIHKQLNEVKHHDLWETLK